METNTELREIDCRIDLLQRIDTMAAEDRLDLLSATELKDAIRYIDGTALFIVYLRWIEGYSTQRSIAERLGISEQAIGKALRKNKRLAILRAKLVFMAEINNADRRQMNLDTWDLVKDEADTGGGDYWNGVGSQMNTKIDMEGSWAQRDAEARRRQLNDITGGDSPDDEAPTWSKNPGYTVMHYRARYRGTSDEGQTNPTVEPTTKPHDDQSADAMKARWAEQKADRIAERRAAREILTQLQQASPAKIERRQAAEEFKRNFANLV